MFSFHRPKVYRSSTGCCICKAKSSSSRFTDSKKYEDDFVECFKLSTPRQGEICNACVLLVKRWKKLPAGSDRNWQHVVDARAGPGIKSMTKFKVKNRKLNESEKIAKAKKAGFVREDSPNLSDKSEEGEFMTDVDFILEDNPSGGSSRAASPIHSDAEDQVVEKNRRYKGGIVRHRGIMDHATDFVDPDYWKREVICCGVIFRGLYDEVMIDPRYMKPCRNRLAECKIRSENKNGSQSETGTKLYSDSSSDSGYDESSNQGASEEANTNTTQIRKG